MSGTTYLEIISHEGVRYQGRLEDVNPDVQSVTLVEVRHFGTEDRHTALGCPSKEAKGSLPRSERRLFYMEYVSKWTAIDPPDTAPEPARKRRAAPEVITIDDDDDEDGEEDENAAVVVEQGPSTSATSQRAPPTSLRPVIVEESPPDDPGPSPLQRIPITTANSPRASSPTVTLSCPPSQYPIYFIAQLQLADCAVGVLVNAHSTAPTYLQFHPQRVNSLHRRPVPTELWEVHKYEWANTRLRCRVADYHYRNGDDARPLDEVSRKLDGMPWLVNGLLSTQGTAIYAALRRTAELKSFVATVSKVTPPSLGRECSVEVEAAGLVPAVELMARDCDAGLLPMFFRLNEGDAVEVMCVRVPLEGSWVSSDGTSPLVLPNIDYPEHKPPFNPPANSTMVQSSSGGMEMYLPHRLMRLVESRRRVEEATVSVVLEQVRAEKAELTGVELSERVEESVRVTIRLPADRGPSPSTSSFHQPPSSTASRRPHYFISQLQPFHERAIGVLVANGCSTMPAPTYVAIPLREFPSSTPPLLSQVWEVAEWVEMKMLKLSAHQLLSGDRAYEVVRERGLTPWMLDFEISPEAVACPSSSAGGLRLVSDAETELCPTQRVVAVTQTGLGGQGRYVEVEAEGCIGTIPLGVSQFDGGDKTGFYSLDVGDSVHLLAVRLKAGCWMGPNYVLPTIEYFPDKPPFTPSNKKRYRTMRSVEGDLYPVKIIGRE